METWTLLTVFVLLLMLKGSAVQISGPPQLTVMSGSTVTLTCMGEGQLVWLLNGTRVMESGHAHFPQRGVIVVTGVTPADTGVYTCSNESSSHSIQLLLVSSTWSDDYNTIRNSVVGGVIGLTSLIVIVTLTVFGVFVCATNTHKVRYEDEMRYEVHEEYVATLNMEALGRLSPDVRAHIDLDFLAKLTNTDPTLLEKYRVEPHPTTDKPVESVRPSPSYISLGSVYVDLTRQSSEIPATPTSKRHSALITGSDPPSSTQHCQVNTSESEGEEGKHRQSFLRILKMVESADRGSGSNLDQSFSS